jgi:hypothetical protein
MYGHDLECVFAAGEYNSCDFATGHSDNDGGYDDGLFRDFGFRVYDDGERGGGGGELCGFAREWRRWDGGRGLDGVGV